MILVYQYYCNGSEHYTKVVILCTYPEPYVLKKKKDQNFHLEPVFAIIDCINE